MRALVTAAVVVAILGVPRIGDVARAPDIVNKRIELQGAAELAKLLGSGTFELSRATERRALPNPRGESAVDDAITSSTKIAETITWDGKVLGLDGWVADRETAFPHEAAPRWILTSPAFEATHPPVSWHEVYDQLKPLAAVTNSLGDQRSRSFTLAGSNRAVVTLYRMNTFDANNKPVERWMIEVAFGPVVAAAQQKPGLE